MNGNTNENNDNEEDHHNEIKRERERGGSMRYVSNIYWRLGDTWSWCGESLHWC